MTFKKSFGAERSADDWFVLVVQIDKDIAQADAEHRWIRNIDHEDRRFVRKMINLLALDEPVKPTAAQAKWLLAIRGWIDKEKSR